MAKTGKIALQKYYSRLVYRGTYKMEQIPEEDNEAVQKLVEEMIQEHGPYIPDPETTTEEIK